MKRFLILVIITSLWVACIEKKKENEFSQGYDYDVHIMTNIAMMQKSVTDIQKRLRDSLQTDSTFKKSLFIIDSLKKDITGMPAFKRKTDYRNAAIKMSNFYKKVINVYYKDIIKIYSNHKKDTSGNKLINKYIESLKKEEDSLENKFLKIRYEFARKNNVPLDVVDTTTKKPADTIKKKPADTIDKKTIDTTIKAL
jgi:hypothetical protein